MELPEDHARRGGEQLQKVTDAQIARIDAAASRKEAEVMEV